jgi:translation initiation factor IF-3
MLTKLSLLYKTISKHKCSIYKQSICNFSKKKKITLKSNDAFLQDIHNLMSPKTKQEPVENDNRITERLLCDIIGCKYYPKNEELKIDDTALVSVYDENDKLLGQRVLKDLKAYAYGLNKDIVLRNDKTTPPLVKVMRYRTELVKRLMKKLGRNVDKSEKKESFKYLQLNIGISENDFNNKKDRCREMLKDVSYLRLVVPCKIESNEQVLKGTAILRNLIDELSEVAKVKANPVKRRKSRIKATDSKDPGVFATADAHQKADEDMKKTLEYTDKYKIESERDLEYIDCIYAEVESLLFDSSGIDYEKILQDIDVEGLIKGISVTTSHAQGKEDIGHAMDTYTNEIVESNKQQQLKIEEQIANLEKQSILMNDKRKRVIMLHKIQELQEDLEMKNIAVRFKASKKYFLNLVKEKYEKSQAKSNIQ